LEWWEDLEMAIISNLQNIAVFQGTDQVIQDTLFQADGITPQPLTNWTVLFTVYAYGDPRQVFIVKGTNPPGGISIPTPTNGVLNITINAADTANMPPGQYQYRIERIDGGFDDVPTYGMFTVLAK
jgi:hypothetical protein